MFLAVAQAALLVLGVATVLFLESGETDRAD
jgi:hypothetical protein